MGREFCNAKSRRTGKPCRHPAGWGTDHPGGGLCRVHGGSTATGRKHGAKVLAEREARVLALPIEPVNADDVLATAKDFLFAVFELLRPRVEELARRGELYGTDGRRHPLLEAQLEQAERMGRFAKLALDAGVEERRVSVLEEFMATFALGFSLLLADPELGIDKPVEVQQRVVRRVLGELEQGTGGSNG